MSKTYETIDVSIEVAVATVTLQRPDALNAITPTMLDELNDAFAGLAANDALLVVVLTGAGRAFSAGVDLKALGQRRLDGGKVGDLLDAPARRLTQRITTMRPVVVGKVNGFCFTGALELALACDVVIAAEEATFGDTHAKFGLRPTWGMSQRLPLLVGLAKARELSYSARNFTGAEAASWGLIARAVPRSDLDDACASLVAQISANSAGSLAAYKDLFQVAERGNLADGLDYEAATDYPIGDTEERIAGFR